MAIDIHSKLVAVVSAVLGTAVVAVAASTLIPNKVIRGEFFNFGVKISKEANEKKTNEANDSKKADEEKKPAAATTMTKEALAAVEAEIATLDSKTDRTPEENTKLESLRKQVEEAKRRNA